MNFKNINPNQYKNLKEEFICGEARLEQGVTLFLKEQLTYYCHNLLTLNLYDIHSSMEHKKYSV